METKITSGEWRIQGPKIGLDEQTYFTIHPYPSFDAIGFLYPHSVHSPEQQLENVKGICNAVNNTYGKGIKPESIPDIISENASLKSKLESYSKDYKEMGDIVLKLQAEKSELLEALTEIRNNIRFDIYMPQATTDARLSAIISKHSNT